MLSWIEVKWLKHLKIIAFDQNKLKKMIASLNTLDSWGILKSNVFKHRAKTVKVMESALQLKDTDQGRMITKLRYRDSVFVYHSENKLKSVAWYT